MSAGRRAGPEPEPGEGIDAREATRALDPEKTHALDPDATLDLGAHPAAGGADDPIDHDRFEILGLLGQGGMGRVYEARDRELGRPVAVKVLLSEDPDQLRRFRIEAESQARLEHECVCRIYEVGEVRGRPYIVMQRIDGRSLRETAPEMGPEEILASLKKVAEAIHEAHRAGLVHRDLKPANILIERDRRRGVHPYVVDFGLARVQSAPSTTVSGVVMGTPDFMAPEQARGETRTVDRRTDVWGLGATLFAALSGEPPFGASESTLQALLRVARESPRRLRRVAPSVPPDIETIVGRCLEVDPASRYPSARELADDLGRYLDGRPIHARPAGRLERTAKWIRRNPVLASVVAAGLAVALTLLTLLAQSHRTAALEQRHSRAFAEEMRWVETALRHAYAAPLHDVGPEEDRVRQRLERMTDRIDAGGRAAVGPGGLAIGRGLLWLGEPSAAREALERAWGAGYRHPDVAISLARALADLYSEQLVEVQRISDEAVRDRRRRAIEEDLREPARALLASARRTARAAAPSVESDSLLESLLAYLDGRAVAALAALRTETVERPWSTEARLLRARIEREQALESALGGDFAAVDAHFSSAAATLDETLALARSDPRAHLDRCRLAVAQLQIALTGRSHDPAAISSRGNRACRDALAVDPRDPEAWMARAELSWRGAELAEKTGEDAAAILERSIADSDAAIERAPTEARARNHRAVALRLLARVRMRTGGDPVALLEGAITSAREAHRLDPQFAYAHNTEAGCHKALAEHRIATGGDPEAHFEAALAAYGRASALEPDFVAPLHNAAAVLLLRAAHDPERAAADRVEAERLETEVLGIRPHKLAAERLGRLRLQRADAAADPASRRRALEEATAAFRRAIEIDPGYDDAVLGLADVLLRRAEDDPALGARLAPEIGALLHGLADPERALPLSERLAALRGSRPEDGA